MSRISDQQIDAIKECALRHEHGAATFTCDWLLALIEELKIAWRALDIAYYKEEVPAQARVMAERELIAEGLIRKGELRSDGD